MSTRLVLTVMVIAFVVGMLTANIGVPGWGR